MVKLSFKVGRSGDDNDTNYFDGYMAEDLFN